MSEEYRGWTIHYDPPPIPFRGFDYIASDPNGDGEPNAYGSSVEDCKFDLDRLLADRDEGDDK